MLAHLPLSPARRPQCPANEEGFADIAEYVSMLKAQLV
jgi:hypothetical protein